MFVEVGNVLFKFEVLDDIAGSGGKTLDVVAEICSDVVRVALQLLECVLADIMELLASNAVQDRLQVFDLAALEAFIFFQHLVLCWLQHAVQPPEDTQRQHHVPVLVRFVRPTDKVCYGPDEADFFTEIIHLYPQQRIVQMSKKIKQSCYLLKAISADKMEVILHK